MLSRLVLFVPPLSTAALFVAPKRPKNKGGTEVPSLSIRISAPRGKSVYRRAKGPFPDGPFGHVGIGFGRSGHGTVGPGRRTTVTEGFLGIPHLHAHKMIMLLNRILFSLHSGQKPSISFTRITWIRPACLEYLVIKN